MGCVNFIKKTTKEFDFDITALKSDVFKFLEKHTASYDVIFADPPMVWNKKNLKIIHLILKMKS
jgi:23S rRNA G2069 N7-methylase RlmK/C1962 C5-methylase RlmI